MTRITLHRSAAVAAVASLALLAGAGSASAGLPTIQVDVQAGPLASSFNSSAVLTKANTVATGELGKVQRQLKATQERLRSTRNRLRSLEGQARARAQEKVRDLRNRARSLSHRAVRIARKTQQDAIDRARSAVNGAYVVVNRAGAILDQSGGISVSRSGAGDWLVAWDLRRPSCFDFAMVGSPTLLPGVVAVGPSGAGSLGVTTGPSYTGFYLTAAC
jgi:TolA-binding protein